MTIIDHTPLPAIFTRVLGVEGGIKDVGDGMGVTRFGQTAAWLATYGLPTPQTSDDVMHNYLMWAHITKLDLLCTVDDALSNILIDDSVNDGIHDPVASLQSAVGVTPDGVIGPQTIAAVAAGDRLKIACFVLCAQIIWDGRSIESKPSNAQFAAGWAVRRAGHVRQLVNGVQ